MKTREEIEKLKQDWKNDPCWNIEDTEGFKDRKGELIAFRVEHEEKIKKFIAENNIKGLITDMMTERLLFKGD